VDDQLIKTFEGLFEDAEDPIIITNPAQKVKFMNKKAANLFQCVNDTALYLMLTEPSKSVWPRFIENLELNLKDTCVITVQLLSQQFLTMRLYSYYMPEHQLIVSRITVPPLLKNEKTSLALNQPITNMIQNIADGVVLTSLKGQVVTANAKALQYLECELGQIENRSHDVLFMNMEQEGHSVILYYRQLAKYEDATLKVSKVQANGQMGYYRIESRVDAVLDIIITTIIDETEKMTLLNKAEHQDSLFLIGQNFASIVHELRNPITSLTGFLQLIREEVNQDSQHFVQIMESELQRMDLMLEDLLSFSKPKRIQFESFCLLKLVQEVTDLMQVQAILSSTMIEIEYKKMEEYFIFGHRARVKQMIINLVKNAIEATSYRGKIILKLTAPQPGRCALIVSDEGMGMTQQTLENLFKAYYTTKANGTGLGMMFVKKVVEEHNADMMLCTDVGYGTQIKIDFKQQDNQFETYMNQRIFAHMPSELSCG
jgi:two-component system, sporulation sensor kinase E